MTYVSYKDHTGYLSTWWCAGRTLHRIPEPQRLPEHPKATESLASGSFRGISGLLIAGLTSPPHPTPPPGTFSAPESEGRIQTGSELGGPGRPSCVGRFQGDSEQGIPRTDTGGGSAETNAAVSQRIDENLERGGGDCGGRGARGDSEGAGRAVSSQTCARQQDPGARGRRDPGGEGKTPRGRGMGTEGSALGTRVGSRRWGQTCGAARAPAPRALPTPLRARAPWRHRARPAPPSSSSSSSSCFSSAALSGSAGRGSSPRAAAAVAPGPGAVRLGARRWGAEPLLCFSDLRDKGGPADQQHHHQLWRKCRTLGLPGDLLSLDQHFNKIFR
ncbi:corneodesmosin-like [Cavia porcellus]|uniref:corneodesmosin-like n=1 Tax=Cavia porcellus TaxID=10141 RepID=UPI002FE175B1